MKKQLLKEEWYLVLIITMAIWGTLAPATRYLSNVPQSLLALIRTGFASIVLILFLIITRKSFGIEKKDIPLMIFASILGGYIPPLFFAIGVINTSSIFGSLIVNTSPLFIPVFSIILLKEHLNLKRFLLTIMGFSGVVILVVGQGSMKFSLQSVFFLGALILLFSSCCIAVNTILGQNLVKKYGGAKTTTYFMVIGFLALLVHNFISGDIAKISALSIKDLALSVYIGIFPTALTWIIFASSLKALSPSESSLFKLLIPLFTTIYSILFLREVLTISMVIGGLVVALSIYLVQKTEKKKILEAEFIEQ